MAYVVLRREGIVVQGLVVMAEAAVDVREGGEHDAGLLALRVAEQGYGLKIVSLGHVHAPRLQRHLALHVCTQHGVGREAEAAPQVAVAEAVVVRGVYAVGSVVGEVVAHAPHLYVIVCTHAR